MGVPGIEDVRGKPFMPEFLASAIPTKPNFAAMINEF
jgi:hypothetical protein